MNNYESSETLNSTYSRTTSCICHCWYCGWELQSLLNRYKYLQNCTIECDFSLRTNVNRLHHGLDIILGQTQTQLFHRVSKPTEVSLQFHSLIHSFVHSLKAKYDKNKGYSFFFLKHNVCSTSISSNIIILPCTDNWMPERAPGVLTVLQ